MYVYDGLRFTVTLFQEKRSCDTMLLFWCHVVDRMWW